jgi:acetylglutamate kinase
LHSLAVATAVLAGLVNKEITAAINLYGGRAVGISGVDGSLIESSVKDKELGYVGSARKVNTGVLETLLKAGFVPVISPISLYSLDRAGQEPGVINVKDKFGKTLPQITQSEVESLISSGVIVGGMIPKVDACFKAFKAGSLTRIIDGRKPHALEHEFNKAQGGTTIGK